jgi:hypothetical protein
MHAASDRPRSWSDAYLAALEGDPSLHAPFLDLERIVERLRQAGFDIPVATLRQRRAVRKDVRAAEAKIIGEHMGRLRAEAEMAAQEGQEPPEDDLPPALERYLAVYAEMDRTGSGGRLDAVRQLQAEGIEISWPDIVQARRQYPAFDRALVELWEEGPMQAEDSLRRDAVAGLPAARSMFLKGQMPEKYGNRVKVDVSVRHSMLEEGDERLVAEVKDRHFPRPRREVRSYEDDVVEGEVVSP